MKNIIGTSLLIDSTNRLLLLQVLLDTELFQQIARFYTLSV